MKKYVCTLIFYGILATSAFSQGYGLKWRDDAAAKKPFVFQKFETVRFAATQSPFMQLGQSIFSVKKAVATPPIFISDLTCNLPFFCKIEVKMDKAARMPVRFRLGTVDYVDKMEGKH